MFVFELSWYLRELHVLTRAVPTQRSSVLGNPPHLSRMGLHEQADVAIATETLALTPGHAALPVYSWEHTMVVRPDHPLAELTSSAAKAITLEQLAQYPIVNYDNAF